MKRSRTIVNLLMGVALLFAASVSTSIPTFAQGGILGQSGNNAAAAVVGPAGAVTTPSGLLLSVSPGAVFCQGGVGLIHNTTITAPPSTSNMFVVYRCAQDQVQLTAYAPTGGDVPLAIVVSGATTITTITDIRAAYQFPNSSDWVEFVPFTACESAVSGNSTGTNGFTVAGASSIGVIQAQTSVTGTNTHTYVCHFPANTRTTTGKGLAIADVTFLYGVQGGALGTQANVLASGTFNASTVFGNITYPTAGASETASTVAPVRADAGTLVITPVVGSFNTATTTAGGFYSVKFAPATAITVGTDLQQLVLTVTFQCTATTATTTNSPGFFVHYTWAAAV